MLGARVKHFGHVQSQHRGWIQGPTVAVGESERYEISEAVKEHRIKAAILLTHFLPKSGCCSSTRTVLEPEYGYTRQDADSTEPSQPNGSGSISTSRKSDWLINE